MRPERVYRLDRACVHRQLQRGDTFAHLVRFLEDAMHDALPRALFDDPTIAHLYLAARIGHVLPDLIPAPYRVPFSIVLEFANPKDKTRICVCVSCVRYCRACTAYAPLAMLNH